MRRREFVTLVGGTAMAWPLAAHAQRNEKPLIAYISARSLSSDAQLVSAFRAGLQSTGYNVDMNVAVEFQWAEGQYDRLPAMMANAVAKRPAIIMAAGSPVGAAARTATKTIPILFNSGTDPVSLGLVDSLNLPGRNMTGVVTLVGDLAEKNLGLLHNLLPRARRIAVLANPASRTATGHLTEVGAAAHSIGVKLIVTEAKGPAELEAAFASMAREQAEGLLVIADPFLFTSAPRIVALAARHALPAMYFRREFADAGGLMSYGSVASEPYRQLGVYAGRILKGEKPADLPVVQPTKFELVINLRTARALGIDIPTSMQSLADDVIE